MEFTPLEQVKRFLALTPAVEKAIVDSGIILIKYWLEVSEEEQTRRLEARISDPRKLWKLSPMDLKSYSRWYDYWRARHDMFKATDTAWPPWHVVRSDDKRRARLNVISHLLKQVPCKKLPRDKPTLPKRQKALGYLEPDYPYKLVPELEWPASEQRLRRVRRRNSSSPSAPNSALPTLHAHKSIVDRTRLIEPVVRGAIRRLPTRGLTVRIEGQLVMSHRRLGTMRALCLNGPMRSGLAGGRQRGRAARHRNYDRDESRHAFHCAEAFNGDVQCFVSRERATGVAKRRSEHRLPERDLGERRQENDLGARILCAEDQHFGLKASNVARRHVDDASDQPADELGLRVTCNLSARPFPAERAEVDLDLVRRFARPLEWLHRNDAADADVDLSEVVVDDGWLVHQAFKDC
jgi:Polyphosphate kinase 2 (PPK2)